MRLAARQLTVFGSSRVVRITSLNLVASRRSPFACVCPPPCQLGLRAVIHRRRVPSEANGDVCADRCDENEPCCCPSSELSLAPNPTANTNHHFFLLMRQAVGALPPRIRSQTTNGTITAAPGFNFVRIPRVDKLEAESVALAASPSLLCVHTHTDTIADNSPPGYLSVRGRQWLAWGGTAVACLSVSSQALSLPAGWSYHGWPQARQRARVASAARKEVF
ncbi:hypothetical protein B0H67DRAFT_593307 [Lasiosphaeris hirsuta]|uniref:Uncharacterized protein n=1 Tax=Lasiosphaeris hirsuta TaxID=260670 RepID=A0AA39ZWX2_9PEZI|nr:hypothetical protein B0H67DRAFT_593307 [Lasiosphaeris hirsuta]